MLLEQRARLVAEHGATAQREYAFVLGERRRDGFLLKSTEMRLALIDEDVLDADALARLDVGVGVTHVHTQPSGHDLGDCALAGTRRANEHHGWTQRCLRLAR